MHCQSCKKSGSKIGKATSFSSRAAAREVDQAKLRVEQLREKGLLEGNIAAQNTYLDGQLAIKEAEHSADRKEKEALLLKR